MLRKEKIPNAKRRMTGERRSRGKSGDGSYKNLDLAEEVGVYYGFKPVPPPTVTKEDLKKVKLLLEGETRGKDGGAPIHFSLEEKMALIREHAGANGENLSQPLLVYFERPAPAGTAGEKKKTARMREIGLDIIGTPKSIAEAILIKTGVEILKAEGYDNLVLSINGLGDRESLGRFLRELTAYYRKNMSELSPRCRQAFKKDVLSLFFCDDEKCRPIHGGAPKPINFLSEASRRHFKEVLEFLETLEIPYEIDSSLFENRSFASQTVFVVNNPESMAAGKPLAVGARYGNITKKLHFSRDLSGIGMKLSFQLTERREPKAVRKPKLFFIQLGFEAKLKSLKIIDLLRRERIPIHQCLSRDKLISQLSLAESMKIPYTVIIGQKEAVENTAIVRNMANRSQETVPIAALPAYLKKLK